ncbi:hypothetical protein, partial [Microcoleus sp. F10B5]|uniref:hypothetical protein n=1 Tax=Microcoleus sp. F10B5 TaxID=3055341 RepID=UPI0040407425
SINCPFLCGNETIIMDTYCARTQGIISPVTAARISHRNDDERTKPFGNGYANSCCPYPGTFGLSSAATTTNQKTD